MAERLMRHIVPNYCSRCGSSNIRQFDGPTWRCNDCSEDTYAIAAIGKEYSFTQDATVWGWSDLTLIMSKAPVSFSLKIDLSAYKPHRPADAWAPAVAAISEESMRLLGEIARNEQRLGEME